ncbi:unnamed protein product [Urochloa decumbens]|uniref:Uncharacterized protein n=1 Tax=Urochloa decumbens TaxID=240449 RepID=A0ABC9AKV1_9POAL
MRAACSTAGADPAASGWKGWLAGKAQSWFNHLTTKEYESNEDCKTPKQIKDRARARLQGYAAMCLVGLGTMHWGGAAKVLEHMAGMSQANKEWTNTCVRFLTISFICSLLGLAAGTFPTTAPWALFFGGLGAWQSMLFVIALFHLETMEYYVDPNDAKYSFYVSATVFSFYWSHTAQDPLFLHDFGKIVAGALCNLFFAIRWLWECKGALGRCIWKVLCCSANPRNLLPFRVNHRRNS